MGEKHTQANIAEQFYWRTITEDVKELVSVHKILVNYKITHKIMNRKHISTVFF